MKLTKDSLGFSVITAVGTLFAIANTIHGWTADVSQDKPAARSAEQVAFAKDVAEVCTRWHDVTQPRITRDFHRLDRRL